LTPTTLLDFAELAEALRRVTVEITDDGAARGSGVLWPRGCVVTNAHVVRRPRVTVRSFDGHRLEARLMARDRDADLALLRVIGADLPTATLADAAVARVGSLVVAVGHPLGLRGALTAGIVHAIGPIVRGGAPWIHADVRLAPGNSGGPLADVSGAIVGVNAMVVGGLALSVPISRVIDFVRAAGRAQT
jgi:serine protease Do